MTTEPQKLARVEFERAKSTHGSGYQSISIIDGTNGNRFTFDLSKRDRIALGELLLEDPSAPAA